jgi:uroporphyrin-3 C-methyltransferase
MTEQIEIQNEQVVPKKSKIKYFVFIVVVLFIILFIASGFCLYRYEKKMQQQVVEIQSALQSVQQLTGNNSTTLSDLQRSLRLNQQKITWIMPEVNYLVDMAHLNIVFNHNTVLALQQLAAADKKVASLHEPRLLSLRKALATGMRQLKTTAQVDQVGIILQLENINKEIANLPVVPSVVNIVTKKKTINKADNSSWWHTAWHDSLAQFKNIIILRHHGYKVKPLLTQAEHHYVINAVQLYLLQARWAVLNRNQQLFNNSMQ